LSGDVFMSEEKREVTYCDAEKAFHDGSYRSASDEELKALHQACIKVSGPNLSAVERIRRIGDALWQELEARRARREEASAIAAGDPGELTADSTGQVSRSLELEGWDEKRVQELISNSVQESLSLEYKGAGALGRDSRSMMEITKDVSAMANSAGGVLIYGVAEDQATGILRLDPVSRTSFSREWVEQVVGQVRPRIAGVRIACVEVAGVQDGVVYVLEVPQSTTAHQATDCKYYRRYNFQCVPMYDHEIRDVMWRAKHAHVVLGARLVVYPHRNSDGEHGALALSIANDSEVFARYVMAIVDAPLRICGKLVRFKDAILQETENGAAYRLRFSNHSGSPLFPGATLRPVFQFKFIDRMEPEPAKQVDCFSVLVFADAMTKLTRTFRVEEILKPLEEKAG
jgi:hypothetical protein